MPGENHQHDERVKIEVSGETTALVDEIESLQDELGISRSMDEVLQLQLEKKRKSLSKRVQQQTEKARRQQAQEVFLDIFGTGYLEAFLSDFVTRYSKEFSPADKQEEVAAFLNGIGTLQTLAYQKTATLPETIPPEAQHQKDNRLAVIPHFHIGPNTPHNHLSEMQWRAILEFIRSEFNVKKLEELYDEDDKHSKYQLCLLTSDLKAHKEEQSQIANQ